MSPLCLLSWQFGLVTVSRKLMMVLVRLAMYWATLAMLISLVAVLVSCRGLGSVVEGEEDVEVSATVVSLGMLWNQCVGWCAGGHVPVGDVFGDIRHKSGRLVISGAYLGIVLLLTFATTRFSWIVSICCSQKNYSGRVSGEHPLPRMSTAGWPWKSVGEKIASKVRAFSWSVSFKFWTWMR